MPHSLTDLVTLKQGASHACTDLVTLKPADVRMRRMPAEACGDDSLRYRSCVHAGTQEAETVAAAAAVLSTADGCGG